MGRVLKIHKAVPIKGTPLMDTLCGMIGLQRKYKVSPNTELVNCKRCLREMKNGNN